MIDLEHNMTNHPPIDDVIIYALEGLRELAKEFGNAIQVAVPASREQSLALTHLEEALMWSVEGIGRNQEEAFASLING